MNELKEEVDYARERNKLREAYTKKHVQQHAELRLEFEKMRSQYHREVTQLREQLYWRRGRPNFIPAEVYYWSPIDFDQPDFEDLFADAMESPEMALGVLRARADAARSRSSHSTDTASKSTTDSSHLRPQMVSTGTCTEPGDTEGGEEGSFQPRRRRMLTVETDRFASAAPPRSPTAAAGGVHAPDAEEPATRRRNRSRSYLSAGNTAEMYFA